MLLACSINCSTWMASPLRIAENVSGPLAADCYIGRPGRPDRAVAPVLAFPPAAKGQVSTMRLEAGSLPYRAAIGFTHPPLSPLAVNDPAIQAAQLPAANGIGNARGLARIFAAVIGEVDGLRLLTPRGMEAARCEQVRGPDLAAIGMTESAGRAGAQPSHGGQTAGRARVLRLRRPRRLPGLGPSRGRAGLRLPAQPAAGRQP